MTGHKEFCCCCDNPGISLLRFPVTEPLGTLIQHKKVVCKSCFISLHNAKSQYLIIYTSALEGEEGCRELRETRGMQDETKKAGGKRWNSICSQINQTAAAFVCAQSERWQEVEATQQLTGAWDVFFFIFPLGEETNSNCGNPESRQARRCWMKIKRVTVARRWIPRVGLLREDLSPGYFIRDILVLVVKRRRVLAV